MNSNFWNDQEFTLLAHALVAQFPERAGSQLATPQQFVFTTHEVGVVMRATFPRDRQRALTKSATRRLMAKVIGVGGGDPRVVRLRAAPPGGVVRWTTDEWHNYALSLLTLYPQFDLLNSPDLAELRLSHLNKACALMAPERRRNFNALTGPIAHLLGVFAELRRSGDNRVTAGRQVAPPVPASPKPAKVAKVAKLHQVADSAASWKVFWTKAEWIKVAAELHRQYPHAKYPERNHLGGLSSADVGAAQNVLPEDRRRKNLKLVSMTQLRPPLLEAFKAVRHMQTEEAQQKLASAQHEHSELLARAAALAAVPNPWEVAFKPFVALLVREMRADLVPALLPALIAGLQQAGLVIAPRQTPPAHLTLAPQPAAGKTVMRIGIVGNRSSYADELERQFPMVEFTCIESTKKVESVRNCDKIIVLTKFVAHKLDGAVRRVAGERYAPIHGSVSDMVRVIGGWLADRAKGAEVAAA